MGVISCGLNKETGSSQDLETCLTVLFSVLIGISLLSLVKCFYI